MWRRLPTSRCTWSGCAGSTSARLFGPLVLLGAVPAAFQYGLWDSSAYERCRRLELLLLTQLNARDYWEAAAAAAWRRGRGYFSVAVLLWLAAAVSGQAGLPQIVAAAAAGMLLWALYFVLGFRAFSRGMQANGLGLLLTLGLPLVAYAANQAGWQRLALLLPPDHSAQVAHQINHHCNVPFGDGRIENAARVAHGKRPSSQAQMGEIFVSDRR